jgi:hypothetical protein
MKKLVVPYPALRLPGNLNTDVEICNLFRVLVTIFNPELARLPALVYLVLVATSGYPQTTLSGRVTDSNDRPVAYANVYLDSLYDGSATDSLGYFTFVTEASGKQVLLVSAVGYLPQPNEIVVNGEKTTYTIRLKDASTELAPLTISAGTFAASEQKGRSMMLKPLDIVSAPGARADVFQALQQLPGVAQVADETGLFVRGGEAYETRTFIDGLLVDQPFFSDVPNIPGRGRFDPFAFSGTVFSTGAYSAEYGQALSSVLTLETRDMPRYTSSSATVNTAGVNVSHTRKWNRTALIGSAGYVNLRPLYGINQVFVDYRKPPEGWGSNLALRHKTSNEGMVKGSVQYQHNRLGLNYPDLDQPGETLNMALVNNYVLSQASYEVPVGESWLFNAAAGYSYDRKDFTLEENRFPSEEQLGQAKVTLRGEINEQMSLNAGSEVQYANRSFGFNNLEQLYTDLYSGTYAEYTRRFGDIITLRSGLRLEYSNLLNQLALSSRFSLVARLGKYGQASYAYGRFRQKPQPEYLRQFDQLEFEQALHQVVNYQWIKEQYTLRVEAYHKLYQNLVRVVQQEVLQNGEGFARGVDVFWRDEKALNNKLDYWISYSLIDSKRLYQNFPVRATPRFVSTHTAQFVSRYSLTDAIQLGLSYVWASGRPYNNPNSDVFMQSQTPNFHDIGLNLSYRGKLFGEFAVYYLALDNPAGWQNITGYEYSSNGLNRSPRTQPFGRSVFFGVFVAFE